MNTSIQLLYFWILKVLSTTFGGHQFSTRLEGRMFLVMSTISSRTTSETGKLLIGLVLQPKNEVCKEAALKDPN